MDSLESIPQAQFNFWDHFYNEQDNLKPPKVISQLKTCRYISSSSTGWLTVVDEGFWLV